MQNIASPNVLASLDQVQNQALLFICGGMKITHAASFEIDANIEPFDLRWKRAIAKTVGKYHRQHENHLN